MKMAIVTRMYDKVGGNDSEGIVRSSITHNYILILRHIRKLIGTVTIRALMVACYWNITLVTGNGLSFSIFLCTVSD